MRVPGQLARVLAHTRNLLKGFTMMESSWQERIDQLLAPWNRPDSPGCALGVYRDGEMRYSRGYGMAHLEHGVPITPATVFHIASISKQFTAIAIGLLARSGQLSLDDDIRTYVPELRAPSPITFHHLIHHTSGLRDQWDLLRLAGWRSQDLRTTSDILRLLQRQDALNFPTGTRFQYINSGYTLMAIALERITGKTLRAYAAEHVFAPLGMSSTHFHDDFHEIVAHRAQAYCRDAGGGLRIDNPAYETVGPTSLFSTVEDFLCWEGNFLSPRVGDEAFLRQVLTPGMLDDGRPTNYGFGLVIGDYRGLETVEHAGGDAGYRAHFLRFPGARLAVAMFCNFADLVPGQLARQVAEICLASEPSAHAAPPRGAPMSSGGIDQDLDTPAALDADRLRGVYRESISGITSRVEARDGRLFLLAPGGEDYELVPAGERRFRFLGIDVECRFEHDQDGHPTKIVVNHGGAETAVLLRVVDDGPAPELQAADYTGTYHSDELDVRWIVTARGDELVLDRGKLGSTPMQPLSRDELSGRGRLHLRYVRDEAGQCTGMFVSTERVWNVWFQRLRLP
jgi:CubicO group peptidase (beta-lactamase class C family)